MADTPQEIIPRDERGMASSNPEHSFDANKIPKSTKVSYGGKVYTGETEEGRNFIATQNIVRSAGEEAIRAHILENTDKSPEELRGGALMSARTDAEMDLAGQKVDSSVIDKYLVKSGGTKVAHTAEAKPEPKPEPEPEVAAPVIEAKPEPEAPPPAPAPAEPEDKPAEAKTALAQQVETVGKDIRPLSDKPYHSFDANKIPKIAKVSYGGKVYTGETEEGRNFIATQNIVRSAHEEAIRAHILTNTGKSPEELSGRDLMSARTDADMDLAGQQVDSSIIDKYLVPIGATNTPQPAATQAQAEPTQAPQPAATQAQAEPTQAPQPATEASPPVEAPPQTNAPAEDAAQTPEEPTPIDDKEDEAKKFDIEQGKAIAAGLSDYAGGAKDKKNQKKAEENEKGPPGPGIPGKPMQMPNIPKEEPATQGQQGVKTTQGGGQEAPVAKGRVTHAGPGGTRTKTRAPGINGKYKMSPQEEDPIRSPKIRTPEEPADSASAKTKKKTGKKIAVAAAVTGTAGLGKCMSASAASISMLNTIIDLLTQ